MTEDEPRYEPLFCVVTGSPATGFRSIGPFVDDEDAHAWVEEQLLGVDAWVLPLVSPSVVVEERVA